MTWLLAVGGAAVVAALAWGWFEAGWLRKRVLEVEVEDIPGKLDGLRIAHLSDLHLGVPSRGQRAAAEAVAWIAERQPDLVCVTGDLVSRRRGAQLLDRLLRELGPCLVVLGNHDFADSRDPFSQRIDPAVFSGIDGVTVLADESVELELRGLPVQVVGVEPRSYHGRRARPAELADPDVALRILLCHFPGIVRRMPENAFHLVLAGHLHGGQIAIPLPGGKLRLAHPRIREAEGAFRHDKTVLHVSPGVGTTFVPFRFFARPEVTELVVRSTT
jgi:predicted MPP superfamily phosphohydrolase